MPTSGGKIVPPGVEAMLAYQKTMLNGVFSIGEPDAKLLGQRRDVLRILENGDSLGSLMGLNAFETFQHFVAFNFQHAWLSVAVGK